MSKYRSFSPNSPFTIRFRACLIAAVRPALVLCLLVITTLSAEAATITVTTTADDLTPNDGTVSLREAITAINAGTNLGDPDIIAQNPGTFGTNDRINFNIPGTGVRTITPGTVLPTISKIVLIDGYTEPGAMANDLASGDNAVILIDINGASVEAGQGLLPGLTIAASNCAVRGLAINTFNQQILISSGSGNVISGNFLGTDASGTTVPGSGNQGSIGVNIQSPNNTIGGTAAADRNVIGVRGNGIEIGGPGAGATGTLIQGNFIGTDHTGATGFGIGNSGIHDNGVDSITIGGTISGARNIISGSNGDGLALSGSSVVVQGNFIGTDVTGTIAVGNNQGVSLGGNNGLIGGTTAAARNVISGNHNRGIAIGGTFSGDSIQGNYIGVDVTGTKSLGNGNERVGIFAGNPHNHLIGGVTTGPGVPPGNIISNNAGVGINLNGPTDILVEGNIIGADVTGMVAMGNTFDGIVILNSSTGNVIGGTTAGSGNLIEFNGGDGVHVSDSLSVNNSFLGNSIFGNARLGIDLTGGTENAFGVTAIDVGDADTGANNLQNYPVLSSVKINGGSTTIIGTLNSHANTIYRLEFFSNSMVDPSGFGEGQTFLGSSNVTTDGSGNVSFNVVVPQVAAAVTATATDPNGNTSEFSAAAIGQLINISTRLRVLTGDNVLIGGFVIGGTDNKKVVIRGIGPSLGNPPVNLTGVLADPMLEVHDSTQAIIATDDNWRDTQEADILATGLQPKSDLESAVVLTLAPGAYTAIVRGKNGGTGIGLVEAYDVDLAANSKLINISTRGFVDTGDNVMIGGFVIGGAGGSAKVVVRAIGPSLLTRFGVQGALADPALTLFDPNGMQIGFDDNWKDTQQADIEATGLQPTNDLESAILMVLPSGGYTAIVGGKNNTTGIGLVEVFDVP